MNKTIRLNKASILSYLFSNTKSAQQGKTNHTNQNVQDDDLSIHLIISDLKFIAQEMNDAIKGKPVSDDPRDDGSVSSGSASGSTTVEYDDATTSTEIPTTLIANEEEPENNVNNVNVITIDVKQIESARGGASYVHASIFLLITSLLVLLLG